MNFSAAPLSPSHLKTNYLSRSQPLIFFSYASIYSVYCPIFQVAGVQTHLQEEVVLTLWGKGGLGSLGERLRTPNVKDEYTWGIHFPLPPSGGTTQSMAPKCPQVLRGSQVSTDSAVTCLGEGTADVAFLFYEDLNVL